jgi:hypothetical protein
MSAQLEMVREVPLPPLELSSYGSRAATAARELAQPSHGAIGPMGFRGGLTAYGLHNASKHLVLTELEVGERKGQKGICRLRNRPLATVCRFTGRKRRSP